MAFSIDQAVIHIKLTDKGRELLSRGELTFKKYAIGDSEIDYEFYQSIGFDPSNSFTLKPFDNNPDIVSFITQTVSGSSFTEMSSVVSNTSVITNTAKQRGMFNVTGATKSLFSDPAHVKQPHIQIFTSGVTGSNTVSLNKSPAYGSNPTEPVVGDYLIVKWANPEYSGNTLSFNINQPVPYLFYKIENIVSGSLSGNNLVVELDRDVPNFSGYAGSNTSGALVYPNNNNRLVSGDSIQNYYGAPYVTDFVSESMIAFLENYDTPTIDVPVWNMTIIFTKEIDGVSSTDRNILQYYSSSYGGFVRYVQKIAPTVKKIGIVHYTNLSPSNMYGEGLVTSNDTTPTLDLPTIMWHKNTGGTIGIQLTADFASQSILPELNTLYYNLVDQFGNVVGKVFTDMKIFVIEDEELLFAMTYKSNRNWTLPIVKTGFNVVICDDCPEGDVEINNVIVNP